MKFFSAAITIIILAIVVTFATGCAFWPKDRLSKGYCFDYKKGEDTKQMCYPTSSECNESEVIFSDTNPWPPLVVRCRFIPGKLR